MKTPKDMTREELEKNVAELNFAIDSQFSVIEELNTEIDALGDKLDLWFMVIKRQGDVLAQQDAVIKLFKIDLTKQEKIIKGYEFTKRITNSSIGSIFGGSLKIPASTVCLTFLCGIILGLATTHLFFAILRLLS